MISEERESGFNRNLMGIFPAKRIFNVNGIPGQRRKLKIDFKETGIFLIQVNFQVEGNSWLYRLRACGLLVVARIINL